MTEIAANWTAPDSNNGNRPQHINTPQGGRVIPMPADDAPPRLTRLAFHGPLSEPRAARLVARLARKRPASVLDLGCGWGELLLRVLDAVPGAVGTGIDLSPADLARGRDNAAARGLASRVSFVEESGVGTTRGPADLVLCVGSSHVLSEATPPQHTIDALQALRRLVNPGGRVLLGEGFWEQPPSPARIAAMWPGVTAEDHYDLPGLVDLAIAAGFRPEWIETASPEEWDDFESGVGADVEEWLAGHPDHPRAAETRKKADERLSIWLRGSRGYFGLAYLTLIPLP
jgi:SAM-dependent methyltransferase